MTITMRYIDDAGDLEARWAEIWPLMDAGDKNHAEFLHRELRPNREEKAYERILSGFKNDDHWLQVAEEDGEIVAVAFASIAAKGRTVPGRIGETGGMFIKEAFRGQGLSGRMREMRHETLRQHGISQKESAVSAANAQALELWAGRSSAASLRRPLWDSGSVSSVPVRRVKELDKNWAGIWRLLEASAKVTEAQTRSQLENDLAKRGAVFVAGEEPVGVITGRVSVNPWLFVERVGMLSDLVVDEGEDKEVAEALLARMEQWMISKKATDIETVPMQHGEYDVWTERGFEPELLWSTTEL